MAWFLCNVGSGGSELTVTCDSIFAGATITCTDGVTTLTKTCPSASPYIVKFNIPNSGIWTVSSGTSSTSVVITDSIDLHNIPVGATVMPTDDIETWLHCGNVWDKNYTTIAEVLLDASTLQALIASNNASDYLVRSTTWASSVVASSSAMAYIGTNDYCANVLLMDSTWLNAICNSTDFESVLNVKVPTMTSATAPSGVASASSEYSSNEAAWKAFDGNNSTDWGSHTGSEWVQYEFTQPMKIHKVYHRAGFSDNALRCKYYTIKGSNDGVTFYDVFTSPTYANNSSNTEKTEIVSGNTAYKYIRMQVYSYSGYIAMYTIQFYGRA